MIGNLTSVDIALYRHSYDKLINGLTFNIDTQEIEPNRYGEVIAVTYEKRYLHKKADNTKLKSEMTKRNLDLMPFF